jgi:hypothetical protein
VFGRRSLCSAIVMAFACSSGSPRDVVPPTLVGVSPEPGSTGISTKTSLRLTFSEAMDPASLRVRLLPAVDLKQATWNTDSDVAVVTPVGPLPAATELSWDVEGNDLAGNGLTGLATFSFTTAPPVGDDDGTDAGPDDGGSDSGTADTDAGTDAGMTDGGQDAGPPPVFLKRQGKTLTLGGAPYTTVGVNAYGLAGCETSTPFSDADMDAFFGSLRPHSLTRAWAFEAQGLSGVDRMVLWAERHNQMLILSLGNAFSDCGELDGVPSGGTGKDPSWYATGYKTRYLAWVKQVVARFKGSPAIGMWEVLNSPGAAASGAITTATMRAFLDDVAANIRSIDPNHLIESGSEAEYIAGTSDYAFVHGGPDIDVAGLHEYDYGYNNNHTIISSHLMPTLSAMNSINKPLLVTEVGVKASDSAAGCTNRTLRRDVFKQKFDGYLQRGAAAVLIWNWSSTKHDTCAYETVYPQDPIMQLLYTY